MSSYYWSVRRGWLRRPRPKRKALEVQTVWNYRSRNTFSIKKIAYTPRPTLKTDQHTSLERDSAEDVRNQTPEIVMLCLSLHLWMTEAFRLTYDVTKWIGDERLTAVDPDDGAAIYQSILERLWLLPPPLERHCWSHRHLLIQYHTDTDQVTTKPDSIRVISPMSIPHSGFLSQLNAKLRNGPCGGFVWPMG